MKIPKAKQTIKKVQMEIFIFSLPLGLSKKPDSNYVFN